MRSEAGATPARTLSSRAIRTRLGAVLVAAAACGPLDTLEEASCPPAGTELRYEGFGLRFFSSYCQGCHGAVGPARKGAPSAYDFATHESVLALRERIYLRAAGGNASMPPGPDDPPAEARDDLAEWLACGAP